MAAPNVTISKFFFIMLLALPLPSGPAHANAENYCHDYASDFATLAGTTGDVWKQRYEEAKADCLVQYSPAEAQPDSPKPKFQKPAQAKTAEAKPKAPAAARTDVAPDPSTDAAWNKACAARYTSFDPATGLYKSLAGKMRKCAIKPKG